MPRADVAEIVDDSLDGKSTIGNDQIAQQIFNSRSVVRHDVILSTLAEHNVDGFSFGVAEHFLDTLLTPHA